MNVATAEELIIAGIKFPLEQLTEVDEQSTQITLQGQSLIIPKSQLESFVLEHWLSDSQFTAQLDDKKLENFVADRVAQGLYQQARAGAQPLLARHLDDRFYAQRLFESLPAKISHKQRLELFRELVASLRSVEGLRQTLVYPMYKIGLEDPDWLRVNATAAIYFLAGGLKELAAQEFSRALAENDLTAIESTLRFLQELFGTEDSVYRSFRLAQSRIMEVKQLLSEKKVELITPWLKGIRDDKQLNALLGDFIYKTLREQAQHYIQEQRPDLALRVLVWIEEARRTPQVHASLLEALKMLNSEQQQIIADKSIADMLLVYANHDPSISRYYQDCLAQQVRVYLDKDDPLQSELYFGQIEKLKLRDFDLVDELRIEQALVYGQKGFNAVARRKLQQVSGSIGIVSRVRLAMLGLYSHTVMRLVLIISILTFGSAWFLVRYKRIASEVVQESGPQDGEKVRSASADDSSRVTFSARSRTRDPRTEEYAVCLRVLGLQSTSTLKEIKSAYRSKVKDAHPDRQAGGADTASDRFIQLTSAYERALELRIELGIADG